MNPKSQGKGNKKTNKGKKRKKDANVSSDDGNHNKVNVLSTSQGVTVTIAFSLKWREI